MLELAIYMYMRTASRAAACHMFHLNRNAHLPVRGVWVHSGRVDGPQILHVDYMYLQDD